MRVQAMFKCESKAVATWDPAQWIITFRATNKSDGDNMDWSKWTPTGSISMTVTNPEAVAAFEVGSFYRLSFDAVASEAAPA